MQHAIYESIVKLLNLFLTMWILITPACSDKKNAEKRDPNAHYASMEKVGNHEVVVCDVSKISKKVKFPLSKLVDICEMIYLETTDASMLPELRRYAVSDNYLCVAGFGGRPAKLFKRDGSFICDIGRIGRGPGEYNSTPSQIILEEKNNSIFMIPAFNVDNILHYDLRGNYVGKIPLLYKSPKARIWMEGDTITVTSLVFDEKTPKVYQQTFEGKLIQQLPVIKNLISNPNYDAEILSSNSPYYDFHIVTDDTLFHYNPKQNTLEPQLVSPPFSNRGGQILRELPVCYFGSVYIKKGDNKYDRLDVIINKKTLKASFIEIVNDYYGGISVNLFGCNKDMFIASTPAFKLMDEIKQILKENNLDAQTRQKLEKIFSQLHENDNDVVFVGKLKQTGN